MEWMLLVADDIDDFVGSLRHCLLGVRRELTTILLILASVLALVAVSVVGSRGI
jgi:nitrate reductase NapE component